MHSIFDAHFFKYSAPSLAGCIPPVSSMIFSVRAYFVAGDFPANSSRTRRTEKSIIPSRVGHSLSNKRLAIGHLNHFEHMGIGKFREQHQKKKTSKCPRNFRIPLTFIDDETGYFPMNHQQSQLMWGHQVMWAGKPSKPFGCLKIGYL